MGRMRTSPSRWRSKPYDVAAALRLRDALGISRPLAAVLVRRGLGDPDEARRFLAADERHDPALLPGLADACELILGHVRNGSRIAVHGDYDVDGVCSTAILVGTLRRLGASPSWELPSRDGDGYGLSRAAVERMAARGVDLLVTVDCGITAVEPVAAARAAGMDVIVTDHHRPADALPDCPIVHPALGDAPYPTPELCAAGVALKLADGLLDAGRADEFLDLAALATVCDLVPLRGENRRIVREGLASLSRTRRPGLRALMKVAALEPGEVTEHAVGFRLGPRLNAAGRMARADAALELLTTEDEARAEEVARELDLLNADRRDAEQRILWEAEALAATQASAAAIVVAGEGWHPGVVGIVASRLVERWRRPAVVIGLDGDSGRGSARSVSAYDLHGGLGACSEHLLRFGGHRMAAGLEIEAARVDDFRRALAADAGAALTPADLIPVETVDAVVPGGALGLDLADDLERLRPFGIGNPQPTLLVPAARFEHVAPMGDEKQHARFTLVTSGGVRSRGVAFGTPPSGLAPASKEPHDIALRLERNRWQGVVEPRVCLRAMCPTEPGELLVLGEHEDFWHALRQAIVRDPLLAGVLAGSVASVHDRRGEGVAGVAGDLLSSGEAVLVAVADVPRRRVALESLVAGLAPEGLAVASWATLAADPGIAAAFDHLVALDPPPGGQTDPLLATARSAHLSWGPADAEFALAVWRAELDLRPALRDAWVALRELAPGAPAGDLRRALAGSGRYPRNPALCARIAAVLAELGLAEIDPAAPSLRILSSDRTDLERSATYRAGRDRLAEIERALAPATPAAPARAA
jgi:single-stranded-DNA-specific exonuclease